LEATRKRAQIQSLALSDRTGILVAGAGPARECDELAAWAPIVLAAGEPRPEDAVCGVKVRGLDAYLCANTTGGAPIDILREAAEGCARILGVARAA
ncbi:MAG: hypothetical protein M3020_25610, partial [Myxococcota bacterium]|nr:hypothetical protein [Myxococcota bacterium]